MSVVVLHFDQLYLITTFVVDVINAHLQERLGDLNAGSVVAKFKALDHTLWPAISDSQQSKEAFVLHGRDDIIALWDHYSPVLEQHQATREALLHEFRLYKSWARSRQSSARETFLALLQRGTEYLQNGC